MVTIKESAVSASISLFVASLLVVGTFAPLSIPAMTEAAVDATTGSVTNSPVSTGANASASLTVTLSDNDDWRSTRVEVSVPGFFNDIDVCINTDDATSNGSHTRTFSFATPSTPGNYAATFRAYENSGCGGGGLTDSVSVPFVVADACDQQFVYEKSSDFSDNRVFINFENNDNQIDVSAQSGYSVIKAELDVSNDNQSGYHQYATGPLDNFDPNPGTSINAARVTVKKSCVVNTPPSVTGLSNDATPTKSKTWSWGANEAATFRYVIDQNPSGTPSGSYGSATSASQNSGTGTYYIHVQAKDALNLEGVVVTVSAILDNTAPTLVVVTPVATPANDSTPSYTFSSNEAGTVTVSGACSAAAMNAVVGNNTVTFNALADNTYTDCTIRVTDALGNQSTLLALGTFTVDTQGPMVTLGSTVSAFTNVNPIPFTALFTEMVNGFVLGDISVSNGTAAALNGSGTSFTFNVLPGGEGPISVSIPAGVANDAAGNGNAASATINTTYDITAPTLAMTSGPVEGSIINTPNVTFTFTTNAATIACALDGGSAGPCTTSGSHTLAALTDGPHTFTVFATDEALNQYSKSVNFTLDTVLPVVTITPTSATVEATGPSGAVATYTVTAIDNVSGNVAASLSCDHASGATYPLGATTVTCTATDAAGNIGTGMAAVTVVDTTAPSITVSPEDQHADTTNPDGVAFEYDVTASDIVDTDLTISCTPIASGSLFPIGTTVVTCTATDDADNSASDTTLVAITHSAYEGGSTDASPFVPEAPAIEIAGNTDESPAEGSSTDETEQTTQVAGESADIGEAETTETAGEVAGASCSPLITSYIGRGISDADDVKRLQEFLNKELSITLDITGIFDSITKESVKVFQLKYASEVLAPWAPFGLSSDTPTGIVYKTTQRMINMLSCAGLVIPMPQLP